MLSFCISLFRCTQLIHANCNLGSLYAGGKQSPTTNHLIPSWYSCTNFYRRGVDDGLKGGKKREKEREGGTGLTNPQENKLTCSYFIVHITIPRLFVCTSTEVYCSNIVPSGCYVSVGLTFRSYHLVALVIMLWYGG